MEFIKAKTIISKTRAGDKWFGIDYNMNLYRGCPHGCIYCDSRSSCYHIDNFDTVKVKENSLELLETELAKKRTKGVVGIGAMSDTYNPFEAESEITRGALKLLLKYGYGAAIATKSDLILRDLDLLQQISSRSSLIVKLTVTAAEDELSKTIEPGVCPSSARLAAVKALTDAGIFAGVIMAPVLPFITDYEDNIRSIVRLGHESGSKFIYTYMGVTLRENQRDYYFQKLDEKFIGLKNRYMAAYKNSYSCSVPNAKNLYEIFSIECRKYGILYTMPDIIARYKKSSHTDEQLSLL